MTGNADLDSICEVSQILRRIMIRSINLFGIPMRYLRNSLPVTLTLFFLFLPTPLPCQVQAAAGDLDPTFGNGGKVFIDFAGTEDTGYAAALEPDGKIVVAGISRHPFVSTGASVARYNSDGSLDTTFGNNGAVILNAFTQFFAVAVQPDSKIVAGGQVFHSGSPTGVDFLLVRFNTDGSLDSSFGIGGSVETDFFNGFDDIEGLAIQADGKIVGVGRGSIFDRFVLARYNPNGSLDLTFGNGGKQIASFGFSNAFASDVAIRPDGKILAVGQATNEMTGNNDFALAQFDSFGNPDPSFDMDGLVTTAFSGGTAQARSVALQSDGKAVVAGSLFGSDGIDFALARYNTDGSLDTSFDDDGRVTTDFLNDADNATGVVILADGKIIAAGFAITPASRDFALARYNSDGSLDTTFGIGGKVITDIAGRADVGEDTGNDIILQPDQKVVVVGTAQDDFLEQNFALARYTNLGEGETQCLQDDSNGNLLRFNTTTGEYEFTRCSDGLTLSGVGTVTINGCTTTLMTRASGYAINASVNTCQHKGSASVVLMSAKRLTAIGIRDMDTSDNICSCPNSNVKDRR